jgi:hydrogenase maturation protease
MVVRLSGDDWLRPGPTPVSLHEVGLAEALTVVCQLGIAPHDVTVIGVRPFVVEAGLELSSEMAALLPRIVKLVLAELGISAATEDKS